MKNNIMDFLDLSDPDSEVVDSHIIGPVKYLTIQKILKPKFCPVCGSRLHSKGTFRRHPNNQVLQDGSILNITLIGRRWYCSNPDCDHSEADSFPFIDAGKRNTKIIEFMILQKMKDLSLSCTQIARMFGVSDTYVHDTFTRYVDLPRLPLTDIISIDEVYLNTSHDAMYALVIMDFRTGNILDIVRSRREKDTNPYFEHIPMKERNGVKFVVCDMYNAFIAYTKRYFLYASAVTDSFHVIQWIIRKLSLYINQVKKRYQKRDQEALKKRNHDFNKNDKTIKDSPEVYILKHASWVLLKNSDDITYHDRKFNRHLGQYLDTYDWQRRFMELDTKFPELLELKEKYIAFNKTVFEKREDAEAALNELIKLYRNHSIIFIREFGGLLHTYRHSILNSFTYISAEEAAQHQEKLRRISNGPIESFNNLPSSYRTRSHGINNFEFTRNRILWAVRDDAEMLAVPKSLKDIHLSPEEIPEKNRRGHYKTKK